MTTPDAARPLAPASPTSPSVFVDRGRRTLTVLARRAVTLAVVALVVGLLAGLLWWVVVDLPSYVVDANSGASTSERGLTEFFGTDAWFVVLGIPAGTLLGLLSWWWFGRRGWLCVPISVAAALLAALTCWSVGELLGPHGFDERIAAARPGDRVEIDFALRAWTAVLVWPLLALVPVLVGSAVAPDGPAQGGPTADQARWRGFRRSLRSDQRSHQPDQDRGEHQAR